jgi:hypothetical protein
MLETSSVEAPDIRYTQSGDVSVAYAIKGEGPIDVVFVHGYMSNLEVEWEDPGHVAFFTKLASAGRVIPARVRLAPSPLSKRQRIPAYRVSRCSARLRRSLLASHA